MGDEWRTPPFVFDFFDRRFAFTVDLAATPANALCACFCDRECDSLSRAWSEAATVGWCNPPYSRIEPWFEKARVEAADGFTTVLLVPQPNGERSHYRHVFGVASEVIFIEGRLAFLDGDGRPRAGNRAGSMVVVYRGHDLGHTRFSWVRRDDMKREAAA